MKVKEDLQDFYQRICHKPTEVITQNIPHINVFERASCTGNSPYSRRDFYKVTLVRGKGTIEFADKIYTLEKPAVLFSTPKVPYNWKPDSGEQLGWFCIFNEAFAREQDELLSKLPMFQIGTEKLFYPDEKTEKEIAGIFEKMMVANAESYEFKQDLLRNYLHLIVHHILRLQPVASSESGSNASERITSLFLELLERQFPIDYQNQLTLKSAKDFADQLSVHTNHLNRSVKEITGQTTTTHIAKRIVVEANDLLRHSNWAISEIAFALGFEYPAYFNNFYKKHSGITPKEIRKSKMLIA